MNQSAPDEYQIITYGSATPQRVEGQIPFGAAYDRYPNESSFPIRQYWEMLLRRRWTVLAAVVIITTATAIQTFRTKPVYRATARIEVDSEAPQIQTLQDMYQQLPTDEDFLRTQIQVLQTDQLAWRTIQQLGLAKEPGFLGSKVIRTKNPDEVKARLIGIFKDNESADLVPSSRILRITYESTDPQLSAKIANGLVDNYVEYNFREKYDATRQASARMEQQLDELKSKVEKSQQALVQYQREHQIANVNDRQNVVEQRLADLSSDYSKAQADRMQKESLYNVVRADPSQIVALSENSLLEKLQEKSSTLAGDYNEALVQYGPNFPKVLRLKSQLAEADAEVQRERQRTLNNIKNDYLAAVGREKLVAQEVAKQKEEVGNLNTLLVQQNILQGEFDSNQKLYEELLRRLKDATVSAGLRSANVHLVDPAQPPIKPIRPRKTLNILVALMVGLIVGVGLVVVQESMDYSVKSCEVVESIVSAPTLAIVPKADVLDAGRQRKPVPGSTTLAVAPQVPSLAILKNPRSAVAEAYRALRTSLLLSVKDHRTLLVTSANAGEGKSCTAVNLAASLGQCGETTLLMECDLRRPSVARVLGLDNRRGMSTILSGRNTFDEVVQKMEGVQNVSVITAGPISVGPAELLTSPAMQTALKTALERFTYVIIDSPPMLAVTDASILASMADGIVLVVEIGVTPRKAVSHLRRLIDISGAKLVGVVMNKLDLRNGGYYGYFGYGKYDKYGRYRTYGVYGSENQERT